MAWAQGDLILKQDFKTKQLQKQDFFFFVINSLGAVQSKSL